MKFSLSRGPGRSGVYEILFVIVNELFALVELQITVGYCLKAPFETLKAY